MISNDAVVFGMLMAILGGIFATSKNPKFAKFYKVVPALLLCYFLPSLLTSTGLVDPSESKLYFVASRYLLPTSLVLLTLSIDLREILRLGPKALIMFLTGTVGVILGGPIALLIVGAISPETVGGGPEELWRGLTTVAGSWIGGGANQAAMFEIFQPSEALYGAMITVDVLVSELWMIFLLLGVGKAASIDRFMKADASAVERLKTVMAERAAQGRRIPSFEDVMIILALGFGASGLSHAIANWIAPAIQMNMPYLSRFSLTSTFFWLIVLATTFGMAMSFTKLQKMEGAGASRVGSVCIYVLVATIGLKMDVREVFHNPGVFVVGVVWMIFHIGLLFIVARIIRAPYFFLAVGSKANIGGAASAPVVAAAFHPSLAPVGVLLAVLGYALGTYGAWICGLMMQAVS